MWPKTRYTQLYRNFNSNCYLGECIGACLKHIAKVKQIVYNLERLHHTCIFIRTQKHVQKRGDFFSGDYNTREQSIGLMERSHFA